jgi:FkbM family methyltransferase
MSIATRLSQAWLHFRFSCGLGPSDITEGSAYLRWAERKQLPASTLLKLPWGGFACTSIGIARSQFDEIFVRRFYAFRAASTTPTIIDCGGNIGLSALWFKQNYPGASLTVYEADAALTGVLRSNLERAGYTDVRVMNQAVWTKDCELAFSATGIDTGKIDQTGIDKVPAIDLATALPAHVDLLKMDIEGAEFAVLHHLLDAGAVGKIANLAVEFHPSHATFPQMLALLQRMAAAGFRISFESFVGPFCGLEETASPFELVGRNRVFVQAYFWRP